MLNNLVVSDSYRFNEDDRNYINLKILKKFCLFLPIFKSAVFVSLLVKIGPYLGNGPCKRVSIRVKV